MEFNSSDLGMRDLGIVLSNIDSSEESSPEGQARYVLNGIVLSYKSFLQRMSEIDRDYGLPTVQAKLTPIALALQDLEKRLNNGREILKTGVVAPKDKIQVEIAVKSPDTPQNSAADAIREEAWLSQLVARSGMGDGSHLTRQAISLRALNLGSEVAYHALKNCCPERQEWLLGDLDWFKVWEEKWLLSKQNPLLRARLDALNRLIAQCEEKLKLTMALARKRAGQEPSPEQAMRERLQEQGTQLS